MDTIGGTKDLVGHNHGGGGHSLIKVTGRVSDTKVFTQSGRAVHIVT